MKHLDLFSGIGGFRRALELLCEDLNIEYKCIGFSEIDTKATTSYKSFYNTENEIELGDIVAFTKNEENIKNLPDFDILTGGFPCQTFSTLGHQKRI